MSSSLMMSQSGSSSFHLVEGEEEETPERLESLVMSDEPRAEVEFPKVFSVDGRKNDEKSPKKNPCENDLFLVTC